MPISHYLVNSSYSSSHLINRKCEWTLSPPHEFFRASKFEQRASATRLMKSVLYTKLSRGRSNNKPVYLQSPVPNQTRVSNIVVQLEDQDPDSLCEDDLQYYDHEVCTQIVVFPLLRKVGNVGRCGIFCGSVSYRPQTKFAKVMFSQVSVCPQGVRVSVSMHAGIHTPRADTPPRSACWDTVNKRAVRIPLECILVLFSCTYRDVSVLLIYTNQLEKK